MASLILILFAGQTLAGCTAPFSSDEDIEEGAQPEFILEIPNCEIEGAACMIVGDRLLIRGSLTGAELDSEMTFFAILRESLNPDGKHWNSQDLFPENVPQVGDSVLGTVSQDSLQISFSMLPPGVHTFDVALNLGEGITISKPITIHVSEVDHKPILDMRGEWIADAGDSLLIDGRVEHSLTWSCTATASDEGDNELASTLLDGGTRLLVETGRVEASFTLVVGITCGVEKPKTTWSEIKILLNQTIDGGHTVIDSDGDSVEDDRDLCIDGLRDWMSGAETDRDSDGCHDTIEDEDDDGDGRLDLVDECPRGPIGIIANSTTDLDGDGCIDDIEDDDDDGDTLLDDEDSCPRGEVGSSSNRKDHDHDGCTDSEDPDDDGDGLNDSDDNCPKSEAPLVAGNSEDKDHDGCHDRYEDIDDDGDGIGDFDDLCQETPLNASVDERGCPDLDQDGVRQDADACPNTPSNETSSVNVDGCGPSQRDSDGDHINDSEDICPSTPINATIDSRGCSDLDEDGVYADHDLCPNTPQGAVVDADGCTDLDFDGVSASRDLCPNSKRGWGVDENGCEASQWGIPWNATGPYSSARLGRADDFSVSTTDGTFRLSDHWDGNATFLFWFKYDGSSMNSEVWGQNPRSFLLNLPENTHILFGSYDSSADSDVKEMRNRVYQALSTTEETALSGRIHYITTQGGAIGGSFGDVIQAWNSFGFGIDRYQQWREIGSFYNWARKYTTDPNYRLDYLAEEGKMYEYEFESVQRMADPSVRLVPITETGQWHSGGWQSGYTSRWNATFPNASEMLNYDTLEIYAYNPCTEHRDRYGIDDNGDGQADRYGGCHEWDYLAYLHACDNPWNGSTCNELVRYITTYGREGRWLTDVSELLFLLKDGGAQGFRYQGANGYGLDIVAILSDHPDKNTRPMSGAKLFTGGNFDEDYNNLSKYIRDLTISVPLDADISILYSVVTGHGFGKDAANCAEFCNHEHRFTFEDGWSITEAHPMVGNATGSGDREGCRKLTDKGGIANQFGSWPFGRAGWCAGMDVKPFTFDVSNHVTAGTDHLISYRGLYNGQDYSPTWTGSGTHPEIRMESWLIFHELIPIAPSSVGEKQPTYDPPNTCSIQPSFAKPDAYYGTKSGDQMLLRTNQLPLQSS